MLITAWSYTTTQRLHSSEFTLVDKVVHSMTYCCPLRRTPFSNVVHMRTCNLVPKLKTTVIGLGARLAHVKSRVDQRTVRHTYGWYGHFHCSSSSGQGLCCVTYSCQLEPDEEPTTLRTSLREADFLISCHIHDNFLKLRVAIVSQSVFDL